MKTVPGHIPKPSYYKTGHPVENIIHPEIKDEQQIIGMKRSCRLAATILDTVGKLLQVNDSP